MHVEQVAGAFGFFFLVAIIHILRIPVAGFTETLLGDGKIKGFPSR
jgi:hypothetical protein